MNKVILIGNLTRAPELRVTQSGLAVCSFGLAVNRRRKQEGQPDVDFFNVTAWRQLGENCAAYLDKGRKVCVVGQIQIRQYDGKDGTKKTAVDIIAEDVEFLSSARDSAPAIPGTIEEAKAAGFEPVAAEDDELPF